MSEKEAQGGWRKETERGGGGPGGGEVVRLQGRCCSCIVRYGESKLTSVVRGEKKEKTHARKIK